MPQNLPLILDNDPSTHTKVPAPNTQTPRHLPWYSHLQHEEDLEKPVIPELQLLVASGRLLQHLLLTDSILCNESNQVPSPTWGMPTPCHSPKLLGLLAFLYGFGETALRSPAGWDDPFSQKWEEEKPGLCKQLP